jgi:hypothetical protein
MDGILKFSLDPVSGADCFVIDVVGTVACDLSVLELSDVLAAIFEEEVALAVFFEIDDLSIVDFSIGIFYFSFFG